MKKIRFLIFLCFAFFFSCTQDIPVDKMKPKNQEFEKFSWLVGKWNAVSATTHYEETWAKTNDSTLAGFAFMITKIDTVFSEKLKITVTKNGIFYATVVADQNNGDTIIFEAVKNERGLHIFENLKHDFPQKILYFMKSSTQLLASVSGLDNGKYRKEDFQLIKVSK